MPIAICRAGMRRAGEPSDAGLTLVEVLISASLFTVVLSLVGAGLGEMAKSAGRTTALSNAQDALRLAWQRLEGEVRYASAIGAPAQVSGDASNWHVVFATAGGCTELRLDAAGDNLDQRDVTAGSPWATIAPGVTAMPGSAQPLTLVADPLSGHQALGLSLAVSDGGSRDSETRTRVMQFTAESTTWTSTPPATCVVAP
ncbi:hypothetical protein [Actinoplanes sp. NPDC051411]|uniref:PulJ/GspJ family protein n=1 Tax=Actinoplanes sp. NPDC051411 TaxID=3155522 RepID=UPI00342370AF